MNPTLPPDQLAEIVVDERTEVLTVDGATTKAPPAAVESQTSDYGLDSPPDVPRRLYLAAGCHVIEVEYRATYHQRGNELKRFKRGKTSYATGPGTSVQTNEYSTLTPINFWLSAKPSHSYWVTATFTGDDFLPRVIELNPAGERVATVVPDVGCSD